MRWRRGVSFILTLVTTLKKLNFGAKTMIDPELIKRMLIQWNDISELCEEWLNKQEKIIEEGGTPYEQQMKKESND